MKLIQLAKSLDDLFFNQVLGGRRGLVGRQKQLQLTEAGKQVVVLLELAGY